MGGIEKGERKEDGGKKREKGYVSVFKMEGTSALWSWCPSPSHLQRGVGEDPTHRRRYAL